MKILLSLMLALLVAGCAGYQVQPSKEFDSKILKRGEPVYIATPRDGRYGQIHYEGSGLEISHAVENALHQYSDAILRTDEYKNRQEALLSASEAGSRYLFMPYIIHWEDRATEWSGRLDRIALSILVLDVANGEEIIEAQIIANSSWFTFGGDHPQDLLQGPIDDFVTGLYVTGFEK
jgi:uncharacterized protein DUF4823